MIKRRVVGKKWLIATGFLSAWSRGSCNSADIPGRLLRVMTAPGASRSLSKGNLKGSVWRGI
jgi:hypothetical protein